MIVQDRLLSSGLKNRYWWQIPKKDPGCTGIHEAGPLPLRMVANHEWVLYEILLVGHIDEARVFYLWLAPGKDPSIPPPPGFPDALMPALIKSAFQPPGFQRQPQYNPAFRCGEDSVTIAQASNFEPGFYCSG